MDEMRPTARERMRLHRQRRRAGYLCVTVEIGEHDLDGLIRRGHLDAASRHDRSAICDALHRWFDATIANG